MWYYVVLGGTMWYYVVLCGIMWYYVVLCGAMWYYVAGGTYFQDFLVFLNKYIEILENFVAMFPSY